MKDQAQGLRELIKKSQKINKQETFSEQKKNDARFICVSSGKGGVGKTNFTISIAIKLSQFGRKVLIIDADLGLSNIDVVLGLMPKYNLSHVLDASVPLKDIIVNTNSGISIISGGSGLLNLVDLGGDKINKLIDSFFELNNMYDYIFIDTGAGINRSVLSFVDASHEVIIVMTPEPTSITDAYALIKNIADVKKDISVVINRAESASEASTVFAKLDFACKKFLNLSVKNLGNIPDDTNVMKSVKSQQPFILSYPNSQASKAMNIIANNLEHGFNDAPKESGFKTFIKKLFG